MPNELETKHINDEFRNLNLTIENLNKIKSDYNANTIDIQSKINQLNQLKSQVNSTSFTHKLKLRVYAKYQKTPSRLDYQLVQYKYGI